MNVTEISDLGATFGANLYSLGTEEITNYGFVWGIYDDPDLNNNRIYLDSPVQGIFSTRINSTLKKDVKYFVKPFVQTDKHTVYGSTVSFVSLGSSAPSILSFKPLSAAWGDTLAISGRNFSYIPADNIVKLNEVQCNVINASDTLLKLIVSPEISSLKSILSIDLANNTTLFTKDTFSLKPPVLYDYYPKQARWGDTLYLKGKYVFPYATFTGNFLKLGNTNCQLTEVIKDSVYMFIVPHELSEISNGLILKLNNFNLVSSQAFQLLPPYFKLESPEEGTWGDILTLNGKFNAIAARNSFLFDGKSASVISSSISQVKVRVPGNLSSVKTLIEYKVTPFDIFCRDTFLLKAPLIYSVNPMAGNGGSNVTIRGKFFSINNTTVYFGTTQASVINMNDSTITVRVPANVAGLMNVSVKVMLQTIIFPEKFNVTNPIISSISPLSGTFNDEITIEGENFVVPSMYTTVQFGYLSATITSLTSSAIIVKVPLETDSIPRALTVRVGTNSGTSSEKFTLSPPVVQSVSSSDVLPGQDVTITGINFNPDPGRINIEWDIYKLTVKSSSSTEIVATWPTSLPNGNFPLKIKIGGYIRYSTPISLTSSLWTKITAPLLITQPGYSNTGVMGTSLNGFGYLCSMATGSEKMYKFSPTSEAWDQIITNYPFVDMLGMLCESGGIIYYLSYWDYSSTLTNGMSLYNDGLSSWEKVSNFPTQRHDGIVFSLKEKIYMGTTTFDKCDPSNNYQWTQVNNLPIAINYNYASYFSLNDKGYILYNNNQLWMYDPDLNVWTRKSDFPGSSRTYACSFISGGNCFLGTGLGSGIYLSDIWKYNATGDTWSKVADMPNGRYKAAVFSINDKIYIGYGMSGSNTQQYDFYKFDPSGL